MATIACLIGMALGGTIGGLIASYNSVNGDYSMMINGPLTIICVSTSAALGGLCAVILKDVNG